MWQRFPSNPGERGVSLIEFLIYMMLVVIILAGSAQVLFSMRRSATRMELETNARQTSRQAVEYIGRFVRGATDMNSYGGRNNPFAIMIWFEKSGTSYQASWNNVTNASLADVGTDILTVAFPVNSLGVPCHKWPGFLTASTAWWAFTDGCPNDATNMQMFKEVTGGHYEGVKYFSAPLMVIGANGLAGWYQITDYQQSDCANGEVHAVANPGLSDGLNPPGGQPTLTEPVTMMTGPRFVAFRVRGGWLEQKDGMFDPSKDNPDSNAAPSPWHQVLPNVEDLQIAYIFRDGTIWNNTTAHQLAAGTYPGNVPAQVSLGASTATYDAQNIVGLRVTVTATSPDAVSWEESARYFRPAAEDHAAGTARDKIYHRRMSQVIMVRNRNRGQ